MLFQQTENENACIRKKMSQCILFDQTKASDTVHQKILLAKSENCGLKGVFGNFLISYLENRRQIVDFNKNLS